MEKNLTLEELEQQIKAFAVSIFFLFCLYKTQTPVAFIIIPLNHYPSH